MSEHSHAQHPQQPHQESTWQDQKMWQDVLGAVMQEENPSAGKPSSVATGEHIEPPAYHTEGECTGLDERARRQDRRVNREEQRLTRSEALNAGPPSNSLWGTLHAFLVGLNATFSLRTICPGPLVLALNITIEGRSAEWYGAGNSYDLALAIASANALRAHLPHLNTGSQLVQLACALPTEIAHATCIDESDPTLRQEHQDDTSNGTDILANQLDARVPLYSDPSRTEMPDKQVVLSLFNMLTNLCSGSITETLLKVDPSGDEAYRATMELHISSRSFTATLGDKNKAEWRISAKWRLLQTVFQTSNIDHIHDQLNQLKPQLKTWRSDPHLFERKILSFLDKCARGSRATRSWPATDAAQADAQNTAVAREDTAASSRKRADESSRDVSALSGSSSSHTRIATNKRSRPRDGEEEDEWDSTVAQQLSRSKHDRSDEAVASSVLAKATQGAEDRTQRRTEACSIAIPVNSSHQNPPSTNQVAVQTIAEVSLGHHTPPITNQIERALEVVCSRVNPLLAKRIVTLEPEGSAEDARVAPKGATGVIRLRLATENDADIIQQLVKELALFEKEPHAVKTTAETVQKFGMGSSPERLFYTLLAEWREIDPDPLASGANTVVHVAGAAIFYSMYSTWEGRGVLLEDLYVRDKYRRHGIGTLLMMSLAGVAKELGAARFQWFALDWNERAIQFYTSIGAQKLSQWIMFRMDKTTSQRFYYENLGRLHDS